MNTDTFEDELRSLLRDTADAEGPDYVDVDPGAVVHQGRRVVRRRRIATGAAVAAAVVAVGVAGAVVGGVGQDRADTTPAGPTTGLGRGSVSVDLEVGSALTGPQTSPAEDPARVRVDVDERTLTWKVTVTGHDGRTTTRPASTLPANPRFSTYAEVGDGPGLVVGLMPAAATDIVPVWQVDSVGSSFSRAPVPGANRQVFAIRYAFPPDASIPGETVFGGFDWTDGEDVFTSAGSQVRSARFGDTLAFVDQRQGLFGLFTADGSATKQLGDAPAGRLPAMMAGRVPDGSATMESTVLVLLPPGAQRVAITPTSGATVQSVDSAPGGSTDGTMVLVRVTEPKSMGTGIERVRWTNPDGSAGSGTVG